jgi:putative MATE family efflux protein
LGDPRKAVVRMAFPIALALLVQYFNSVADMFWISGLGADALAAVSIVTPIYMAIISIGNGIGTGASYAISKRIGAGESDSASKAASQSVMMTLGAGLASLLLLAFTVVPLMGYMGAGDILVLCTDYAYPVIIFAPLLMMGGVLSGCLRGEGAAKRSTAILVTAALLNMIFDPVLIYWLDMGIAGAAYATVISSAVSVIPAVYWYAVRKDVLVPIVFKGFRFTRPEVRSISEVGVPQTVELVTISLMSVFFVRSVYFAGGTDLVAVFEITWRIATIMMVPAQAIGFALVPVLSASFGMRDSGRAGRTFFYGLKVSVAVMAVIAVLTAVMAPYLTDLMILSNDSARLRPYMTDMLVVCTLFFPAFSLIHAASALLQSMGRGTVSLLLTIVRNSAIAAVYAFLSTFRVASYMWWGMTVSEIVFGFVTLAAGILILRRVSATRKPIS